MWNLQNSTTYFNICFNGAKRKEKINENFYIILQECYFKCEFREILVRIIMLSAHFIWHSNSLKNTLIFDTTKAIWFSIWCFVSSEPFECSSTHQNALCVFLCLLASSRSHARKNWPNFFLQIWTHFFFLSNQICRKLFANLPKKPHFLATKSGNQSKRYVDIVRLLSNFDFIVWVSKHASN